MIISHQTQSIDQHFLIIISYEKPTASSYYYPWVDSSIISYSGTGRENLIKSPDKFFGDISTMDSDQILVVGC